MFEILWVAPYDRRRSNAALSGFERCSRETAVLLAATDLRSASPGELQTLLQAVDRLAQTIGRLESEALFPAGSVPKRWRRCGGSPPSCRSTLPLPWAEPFAGAGLLRGFAGLLPVCYRFAAGRYALNRFCVAPALRRICLVLNLLCVEPAFAEPPLCRGLLCGVPQLVPAPRALPDVAKKITAGSNPGSLLFVVRRAYFPLPMPARRRNSEHTMPVAIATLSDSDPRRSAG